jgi:hypothetical protein
VTVKRLRSASSNSSDVPGGVLQQKNIHIATGVPGMVGIALKALYQTPKTASLKARLSLRLTVERSGQTGRRWQLS